MQSYNILKGTTYLLVTTIGVVGNSHILTCFVIIAHQEQKLTKPETIFSHLAAANLIVYLTRILPSVFYEFGWKNLFSGLSCKIVSYIFRVFRGMSIGLTCLLSCFQAGILSRRTFAEKQKIQNCVNPVIALLYLANMALNADTAIFATSPSNISDFRYVFNPGFCLIVCPDKISFEVKDYASFTFDLIFVIVMAWASFYLLLILFRHNEKMKAIRTAEQKQGTKAETQAAKTVIFLVSFYVGFYTIDNMIRLTQTILNEVNVVVSDIRVLFNMCYSFTFPVILSVFNNKIKMLILKIRHNKQYSSDDQQTNILENQ